MGNDIHATDLGCGLNAKRSLTMVAASGYHELGSLANYHSPRARGSDLRRGFCPPKRSRSVTVRSDTLLGFKIRGAGPLTFYHIPDGNTVSLSVTGLLQSSWTIANKWSRAI